MHVDVMTPEKGTRRGVGKWKMVLLSSFFFLFFLSFFFLRSFVPREVLRPSEGHVGLDHGTLRSGGERGRGVRGQEADPTQIGSMGGAYH